MSAFHRFRPLVQYTSFWLLFLAVIGLLGGCNLFGAGSTTNGDTVDELVADADVAISKGNYDSAVTSLETAYDRAPENPEVRIKLTTALYGQADLTVVDLKEIVDYVSGLEDDRAGASRHSSAKNGLQCSVEAAEPDPRAQGYEEIDLRAHEVFSVFFNNESLVNRVATDILDQEFSQTQKFETLPADLRASWFTNASFTEIARAILVVHDEAMERGGHLFRDPNDDVVFCAPEQADLEALECAAYRVAEQEDLIGQESLLATALRFLILKNEQFGTSGEDGLLPDALNELMGAVQENIDAQDRQACVGTS
ncbi:hypothetical protein BSZ35_12340 [Salinibacter sp. 10B]|uniref:hypothetical protein n=1 Tax=Salinibacter sp. 10B TaxID=1923971 RepID=UPI000CF553CA|nr:hypothetical protein [Salinibacter sp. 10B]PQJ35284.1 hypothetical protein BSZ35_12340 [Salinibacter sp. 10B]